MARSHAPSLLRLVETTLRQECGISPGTKILVGVSGGPDSLALLHCLCLLREKLELVLGVLSVDHGLRAEAADEVELVRSFCLDQEVPFFTRNLGLSSGSNVQQRARTARYEELFSVADREMGKDTLIATGHQQEDRAETVMLRILRGTSLEGLGVLRPRSDRLIRPMVRAPRSAVQKHVERHGLCPVSDPSNEDARYLRVRVRREILPQLQELGPGVIDHLCDLSDQACQLPEPLGLNLEQRRQLRHALRHPEKAVDLRFPGGLTLRRLARKKGQD